MTLTTDAESCYKSCSSADFKIPTEKTLAGHVSWIREMLRVGIVSDLQWCDTRDMTADGHTKGTIDRKLLKELMTGFQTFQHKTQIQSQGRLVFGVWASVFNPRPRIFCFWSLVCGSLSLLFDRCSAVGGV